MHRQPCVHVASDVAPDWSDVATDVASRLSHRERCRSELSDVAFALNHQDRCPIPASSPTKERAFLEDIREGSDKDVDRLLRESQRLWTDGREVETIF